MSSRKYLEIILGLVIFYLFILVPSFANAVQQNTVSTDYPAYVKNDIVLVSGTFNSPSAIMLSIEITNPNGVSRLWQTNSNSDGTFQTNYPLSENAWLVPGIYRLNVLSGTQNMSSTKFVFISDDSIKIPNELKTITGQWILGKIDDTSFIKNIQYYVNTGMLRISYTFSGQSTTNQPIPQWVYTNSRAWLQGSGDASFAKGLYFLYYANYLPVELDSDFQPSQKLTVKQTANMSNSHVILSVVNGSENVREGQIIELKGKIIEQSTNKTLGIPNAMFSIVDADNGREIGNGTSDYFGIFHFSWTAKMDGKTARNLMGVYHGNEQLSPSQSSVLTFRVLPQINSQSIVSSNKTVNYQKESPSSNTTILSAPAPQPTPQVQSSSPKESIRSPTQSVPNEKQTLSIQNQSSGYDYSSMMTGLVVLVVIILVIYFGYKKSRQSTTERFQREEQESRQREQYERQQREEYERKQREQYEQSQQSNQSQSGSSRQKETKRESHVYSDTIKTYYAILGLEPGASKEQVKERYRELSKMVHPDKNEGSNTSTDIMKKYNEAYHAIMDDLV